MSANPQPGPYTLPSDFRTRISTPGSANRVKLISGSADFYATGSQGGCGGFVIFTVSPAGIIITPLTGDAITYTAAHSGSIAGVVIPIGVKRIQQGAGNVIGLLYQGSVI